MNPANKSGIIKRFLGKVANLLNKEFQISSVRSRKTHQVSSPVRLDESQKSKQFAVEESKYASWPRGSGEHRPTAPDLPAGYGDNKIILQIRDPWWIHSYWEVTQNTKDNLRERLGEQYHRASWALRVYDVSFIIFNGSNAHNYFDILINTEASNWYINVSSGRSFCVDLGLKLKDGTFITVVRSNTVTTPLDGPSWIIDEEWMIPDDEFMKLYGFGPYGSSPVGKRRRIGEYISSSGFFPRSGKKK
ncbi:MAG: DUF4912 domain-containing protein [Candidatus Omnitrophica bacterium]|nr:DUF4912 domain-containing protein [Candidatus Omnitrophota bacterium]MDD5351859.1 DUF4912 domain-containing protein [Candidatus Omnitrophota bacterium]MDD5550685.1 DUF4912 domain-containing protein [Candidatus Omnitrophota bacterium]